MTGSMEVGITMHGARRLRSRPESSAPRTPTTPYAFLVAFKKGEMEAFLLAAPVVTFGTVAFLAVRARSSLKSEHGSSAEQEPTST